MKRFAVILAVVILPAWVLPAHADGIFGLFAKKTKANPTERVPQLIVALKTEQEERKRSAAATELGGYDATTFPEIVPILVDALQHDQKSGVRMDAASSLGSIRPVSRMAGQALEKAAAGDDNFRMRWHAKSILMKYRFAGYSHDSRGEANGPTGPKTGEPPLLDFNDTLAGQTAEPGMQPAAPFPTRAVSRAPASTSRTPPIINRTDDTPEFRPSIPRPLPVGPVFSTAVPQNTRQPAPAARPAESTDGPPLTPLPTTTPAPF